MPRIRKKKITTLLYCEGDTEEICAWYFQSLWSKNIDIKNWYWGSPTQVVQKAINNSEWYDEVFAWIDNDRPEFDAAIKLAKSYNIQVIFNSPDFETEILRILQPKLKIKSNAKRRYYDIYPNDSLLNQRTYKRFSKNILWVVSRDSVFRKVIELVN